MAAVDQVAQAANTALRLGLAPDQRVQGSFLRLGELVPEVARWFNEPIGRDLRRIRTRMVHYTYSKSPQGLRWAVESADTPYKGPRDLNGYADAAVAYVSTLKETLPAIRKATGA